MKKIQAELLTFIQNPPAMERGRLCQLRKASSGGWYYNHQSWEQGRNRVRYVPADQVEALREALAGYDRFMKAVEAYADHVIGQTRRRRAREAGGADRKPSRPPTPDGKGATGRSRAREARRRTAPRAGGRA